MPVFPTQPGSPGIAARLFMLLKFPFRIWPRVVGRVQNRLSQPHCYVAFHSFWWISSTFKMLTCTFIGTNAIVCFVV